ncbi:protein DESIGUAL 4-like [Raphanus sativus]|uniref:Protein DESIGUAL 4-like n=1 Tax=Raphanus sativus TaxID=3726 RepID=A0A6J0N380_RAPSA|nr:protein DESIGUAL 4-like [Raphanus sativus]
MGEGGKSGRCFSVTSIFCMFLMVGLDVVAGFVAMQAEIAQEEVNLLECTSPSKKAFVRGLIALGCLLAAHFIAVMIGCVIISNIVTIIYVPKITKHIHTACIYLTWIIATAGAGMLTMGIWMNRESRSKCGFTNKPILFLGGEVCFLHAIVSVIMYVANVISRSSLVTF